MVVSVAAYSSTPKPPAQAAVVAPYIRSDGLTLLVGPEKSGKSTLLAEIAMAVAGIVPLPWARSVRHGPVLCLTAEEHLDIVMSGYAGASCEARARIFVEVVSGPDIDHVLGLIAAIKPALVIADPVDVLASPRQEPRRTLEPLFADIRAKGYGVVGVLHSLHGARPGGKIAKGAGDWPRVARSVLYFGPDPRHDPLSPERRAILYHYMANRGGERGEAHEFGEKEGWLGSLSGLDLDHLFMRPKRRDAPETVMARGMRLLEEKLQAGPQLASDLYAWGLAAGISRSTMDRAANALQVVRTPCRVGGRFTGHWWSLAAAPVEDMEFDAPMAEKRVGARPSAVPKSFPDPNELRHLPEDAQRALLLGALGLRPEVEASTFMGRWRELLKQHHPDLSGGSTEAAVRLIAIRQRLRELDEVLAGVV
jgi:hypothetical protein